MSRRSIIIIISILACWIIPGSPAADNQFETLSPEKTIADFRAEFVYEAETGTAMGGRFRHIPSGFILDVLRIQSIPQSFMWVNTPPPSDQGEPHTAEHLLLGKGTKGKWVASLEDMSLASSSAFTRQMETCYHFHTNAGVEVFYRLLEDKLDALLHPNFSDEEIRREVCNMGYTFDLPDSTLRLEEKGTIYAEMVSAYERAWSIMALSLDTMLYGAGHYLARSSGGFPDSIRNMVPEHLRSFHEANYHINNMGMIITIPSEVSVDDCLGRISEILARLEPDAVVGDNPGSLYERLPAATPSSPGAFASVPFPHQNPNEPGLMILAWPPVRQYDWFGSYLLELFVRNLAGGQTSNLYRRFIDSETRVRDIGARSVFGWVSSDPGQPVIIGFSNVKQERLSRAQVDSVRAAVLKEVAAIGALAAGSPELKEFNQRILSMVAADRRNLREFLDTPPGFGYRGASSRWMDHLRLVQKGEGFRKSLTLNARLAYAEKMLSKPDNIWTDLIAEWSLVDPIPFALTTRPDPGLIDLAEKKRDKRISDFTATLSEKYGTATATEALAAFRRDYDEKTEIIENETRTVAMPHFVDSPPLSLDAQLNYAVSKLPGGGDLVTSKFDNISAAQFGVAMRADAVPESLLIFASALPEMLTDVGVIKDGVPITFEKMQESIRNEISRLVAYYSVNYLTERVELVMKAAGSNLAESHKAMEWLSLALLSPDWRADNLPRIRDAIDISLSGLRNTSRGSEESWVMDPVHCYWRQDNPLIQSTRNFMTQAHHFQRLRWMLRTAGDDAAQGEFAQFMNKLAALSGDADRPQLQAALKALSVETGDSTTGFEDLSADFARLSDPVQALVTEAAADLGRNLAEIPDLSLSDDWQYVCRQIAADLAIPPRNALDGFAETLSLILHRDNCRAFMIGSSESEQSLMPSVNALLDKLDPAASQRQEYSREPLVNSRLAGRSDLSGNPLYVGLVNPNTRTGVVINSVPSIGYGDTNETGLLQFLSSRLYGGGGSHSMFMKTWGAGLAYSNGVRFDERLGRLIYYAERCPDLAQTVQFVVNELKSAPDDPSLAEYAVAQAFGGSRAASRYEQRGEAMALDLADGIGPQQIAEFRTGVLKLSKRPDLYQQLQSLMPDTYGRILPGYGPTAAQSPEGVRFIIGPDKQFDSYQNYLNSVEGDVKLYRLYPRDFWITAGGSN